MNVDASRTTQVGRLPVRRAARVDPVGAAAAVPAADVGAGGVQSYLCLRARFLV